MMRLRNFPIFVPSASGITAAVFMSLYAVSAASAVTVKFDEKGFGFSDGTRLQSGMEQDPNTGITTLRYTLPFAVVTGGVLVGEPGSGDSDLLHFYRPGLGETTSKLFVFSNQAEAGESGDLADVGVPAMNRLPPPLQKNETTGEGANGITYTPGALDPGFAANVTYQFISDGSAPMPNTLVLMACAALAYGFGACIRRVQGRIRRARTDSASGPA